MAKNLPLIKAFTYKCKENEIAFWAYGPEHEMELYDYFVDLFPDYQSVNIRTFYLKGGGNSRIVILNCEDETIFDMVKFTLDVLKNKSSYVAYAV